MKKLWEMKNKKKNNKGFSLVELIVVIAIMAVLVAVLAPALLKYVENSRKSSDATVISGVVSTLQASVISDNVAADDYSVTLNENGCQGMANDDNGKLQAALDNAYTNMDDLKLKANTWKTAGVTVTISVEAEGQTTISYNNADFNEYIGASTGGNNNQNGTQQGTQP